jgi:hypothetical protein
MYEFSAALVSRHRRYAYASDHKTLYFFFKEPSSDSTSQGENGVVAYSNSNTGDICAYFKKRNVSDERKYSLVVSLRTPDQEKLEHSWVMQEKIQ